MSDDTIEDHVLVGTDGSDDGLRAVQYAAREAVARGVGLRIVHAVEQAVLAGAWGVVYDDLDVQRAGEETVQVSREAAVALGVPDSAVSTDVRVGSATAILIEESASAVVTVVGRRSLSGMERIFVGSTSVGVVGSAHSPVIMVSATTNPESTGSAGRVLVASDGSTKSDAALAWGFEEASRRGSRLCVLHSVSTSALGWGRRPDAAKLQIVTDTARSAIEELIAPLQAAHPDVIATVDVRSGAPLDAVVTESAHADLLIVGTHFVAMPGFTLSGVVRGAMAHALCPVGVIRS